MWGAFDSIFLTSIQQQTTPSRFRLKSYLDRGIVLLPPVSSLVML